MLRRIVNHAEFQSFLKATRSCRVPHFFVPVLPEQEGCFAYGITISGKTGTAVQRNLLKRRIKAWFTTNSNLLTEGIKINLIARKGACELDWTKLSNELTGLVSQLSRLEQQ